MHRKLSISSRVLLLFCSSSSSSSSSSSKWIGCSTTCTTTRDKNQATYYQIQWLTSLYNIIFNNHLYIIKTIFVFTVIMAENVLL